MPQNPWGIKEKQLEDWICKNPELALWEGVEIIGRQVPLNHGRLDILAYDGRTLVIEIKARSLKERDVGQVLRYTHDVECALWHIGQQRCPIKPTKEFGHLTFQSYQDALFYDFYTFFHGCRDEQPVTPERKMIIPVLIGLDIESHISASTCAANIETFLWNFESNEFSARRWVDYPGLSDMPDVHPTWAKTINSRILEHCLSGKMEWNENDEMTWHYFNPTMEPLEVHRN